MASDVAARSGVMDSSSSPPPLQTILRQAEERTQLVVECARMVNRLEQLEAEIGDFSKWQSGVGRPSLDYKSRVQRRFEEARARESVESKRYGISPRVPLKGTGRWRVWEGQAPQEPVVPGSPSFGGSTNLALTSLGQMKQALEAVDEEASNWRRQAQDAEVEAATERERARAERLTQFKLSEALKSSEEDRANLSSQLQNLRGQLHERDLVFDQLECEYRALKLDHDRQNSELADASNKAESQTQLQRQLQAAVAARDSEMTKLRRDLEESKTLQRTSAAKQTQAEATKSQLQNSVAALERDLVAKKCELEDAKAAHTASNSRQLQTEVSRRQLEIAMSVQSSDMSALKRELEELKIANSAYAAKQVQMEELRRDLDARKADVGTLRKDFERARDEAQENASKIHSLRDDLDAARKQGHQKLEASLEAERRVEHAQAQCENLEAALACATSRQAEAAWEAKVQRERADNLQEVSRRLLKDLEAGSWPKAKRVNITETAWSPASTAIPLEDSIFSTPRTPNLPRVRPMSAPRQTRSEMVKE